METDPAVVGVPVITPVLAMVKMLLGSESVKAVGVAPVVGTMNAPGPPTVSDGGTSDAITGAPVVAAWTRTTMVVITAVVTPPASAVRRMLLVAAVVGVPLRMPEEESRLSPEGNPLLVKVAGLTDAVACQPSPDPTVASTTAVAEGTASPVTGRVYGTAMTVTPALAPIVAVIRRLTVASVIVGVPCNTPLVDPSASHEGRFEQENPVALLADSANANGAPPADCGCIGNVNTGAPPTAARTLTTKVVLVVPVSAEAVTMVVPVPETVPEIRPEPFTDNPAGRPLTTQPVAVASAVSWNEQAEPSLTWMRLAFVTRGPPTAVIVMVRVPVPVNPALVALIATAVTPAAVGVPEMIPLTASMLSPAGRPGAS